MAEERVLDGITTKWRRWLLEDGNVPQPHQHRKYFKIACRIAK